MVIHEHNINGIPSKDYATCTRTLNVTMALTLTLTLNHYF